MRRINFVAALGAAPALILTGMQIGHAATAVDPDRLRELNRAAIVRTVHELNDKTHDPDGENRALQILRVSIRRSEVNSGLRFRANVEVFAGPTRVIPSSSKQPHKERVDRL
jgi:hypothetical protein